MPRLLLVASSRWGYLWQRHQALATAAAEDGWEVDFLQPRPRNLRQLLSYPLRKLRGGRVEQEHDQRHPAIRVLGRKGWLSPETGYDLALVYLPDRLTERLLKKAAPARIVYDAVLDWAAVPAEWYPPIGWRSSERRLVSRFGAEITTDAPGMADLLATRGIPGRIVPPAADDAFLRLPDAPPWQDRASRALYFGAVRDEVDSPALAALAKSGVPVDVVGPVPDDATVALLTEAGVTLSPPVTIDEIARIAASYRVILLPYRGARAASLAPAKLYNAVATGSWVLSTGLDTSALAGFGNVLSVTPATLVAAAKDALETPPPALRPDDLPTWAARWRSFTPQKVGDRA